MNDTSQADGGGKPGSAVASRPARRTPQPAEGELETGELIAAEDEPRPAAKKIPARRETFDGKSPAQAEPSAPASGQMVLSSAKYLKKDEYNTDSPEGNKKLAARRAREAQKEQQESGGQSLEGKVFNGGFWGGLLAMTVAVLWFVAGLMNDTIYFYPPILFVIGLGAIFKGASGSKE